ncbi:MAG: 30S ribosome-binding factor RbfA [Deltaproteobacteria bacterium]|nr:MAG: 30S ribosome-binding factor RbfA [Deltaproteobacteria bacterium]
MSGERPRRVGSEIQREITSLLSRGRLKDPRIHPMTTITGVKVSGDLAHATVYYTVHGDPEVVQATGEGLNHAAAFVHRHLKKQLHMRTIPDLKFEYDPSIDEGARMEALLGSLPEVRAMREAEAAARRGAVTEAAPSTEAGSGEAAATAGEGAAAPPEGGLGSADE